jgi:anaerobic selenocysteine-containing dehydrogenase
LRFGPHGAKLSPAGSGITLDKVRKSPHGLDLGPMTASLPDRLFTKDKKIHLSPALFVKELNSLKNHDWQPGTLPGNRFDLILVGRRHLMSNNSWFHNFERMHNKTNRCTARMHPEDAGVRGISTGDWIRVSSLSGQIELEAEITDNIMTGSVSIPHGWGHTRPGVRLQVATKYPGVCVNDIVDNERLDTLCGNAVFSGIRVSVEKAGNRNILEKPYQVGV